MRRIVEIWDRPTRAFHWGLGLSVIACWITADQGGAGAHRFFGFVAATLLLFRLAWGVVGSETARFAQFVTGPAAVIAFVKGEWTRRWGHNPLAGWSVLALMAAAGWAVASGLLVGDPAENPGAAAAHAQSWTILGSLVALHVAAIFFYVGVKGEPLLGPMIGGGRAAEETDPPAPAIADPQLALKLGAGSAVLALVLFGFRIA
jgi:cytochrome b